MVTKTKRERSPLDCIPSADAVRRRLSVVLREAEQLKILLTTADKIESVGRNSKREDASCE